MKRLALPLMLVLLLACAPAEEPCPERPFFSAAIVDPDSLLDIEPLGLLNPTGHTFPSDHMYFHFIRDAQDDPLPVSLYSPADMEVSSVRAVEHVNAGHTDYAINLEACGDIELIFGHVAELDEATFAGYLDTGNWNQDEPYSTGGETFIVSWIRPNISVTAGARLGRCGVQDFQYGVDVGIYDWTRSEPPVANRSRWGDGGYLRAFSVLDYYEEGALKAAMEAVIAREDLPGDPYPYGRVMQDVPGSAHGCWFMPGGGFPPEDAHLALVQWNRFPSQEVISNGNSLSTLMSGIYPFTPEGGGRLNRAFSEVSPDGQVYAWHLGPDWTPGGWEGTVLMQMPDANTLWIEGIEEHLNEEDWVFTGNQTEYKR